MWCIALKWPLKVWKPGTVISFSPYACFMMFYVSLNIHYEQVESSIYLRQFQNVRP
jgi:hypothetical protein